MRTENAWQYRTVRTTYDRWELEHGVGFHVHSETGTLVLDDFETPNNLAVLERSTRWRIGRFSLVRYNNLQFVNGFARYITADGRNLVLARLVPHQTDANPTVAPSSTVALQPLAYMDERSWDFARLVPASTADGIMLVHAADGNVRFRSPPFIADIDMVSSMLHAPPGRCDGIPHLSESVVAVISKNETSILVRVGSTTEHRATFPMTVSV
ncbi:uncharacterized protein LOC62_03G005184 [Vanrija pseudolonga]|uniref:Uncharacterized protein n=1 Tax=Vanrija pseudolonga TaxID=143232 RepID=A0AAF0YC10_9TREE|nr:hypothetical protein LOC62_03G005184 [Vanrija pseudolonga]